MGSLRQYINIVKSETGGMSRRCELRGFVTIEPETVASGSNRDNCLARARRRFSEMCRRVSSVPDTEIRRVRARTHRRDGAVNGAQDAHPTIGVCQIAPARASAI